MSPSAVAYAWSANVIGPSYNVTHEWSGLLRLSTSWSAKVDRTVSLQGGYTVKATGTAVLSNGTTCSSGGPIDTEWIL